MRDRPIDTVSEWQTLALYARSGAGKTTTAGSAPRPYFLDSNDGVLSLKGRPGYEHVRGDKVHGMEDLDDVYAKITGTHGKIDWRKRYDSLIYDHFEDIQSLIMDELGDKALAKDESRNIDEWQQKEYGIMGNRLRRYLRKAKKLPKHKVLILAEATDFESGVLQPALIGQLKHQLPYFCDHIAYIRVGTKGRRWFHLDGTDEFQAKTRAWWLPKEQRVQRLEEGDATFLTRFFTLVAKGPQATRSARKPIDTQDAGAGRTRHKVTREK